ncbi:hypothetical protein D3C75_930770 [compost metagenome]
MNLHDDHISILFNMDVDIFARPPVLDGIGDYILVRPYQQPSVRLDLVFSLLHVQPDFHACILRNRHQFLFQLADQPGDIQFAQF